MSVDQFVLGFSITVAIVGIVGVGGLTWVTARQDQRIRERHGLPRRR